MAAPVLLVHDDIATIAAVRRLLSREGYEIILATSAADALIAFGHYLPALIILAPEVESGRGDVVLEELAQHPDRGLARVLLLGESIPGFGAPVVPLPLEGRFFLDTLHTVMRAPTIEEWRVLDQRHHTTEAPALVPHQPEPWRATAPPQVQSPGLEGLFSDLPPLEDANWGTAASPEEGTGFLLASEPAAELNRLSVRDEVAAQTRAAIEAELDAFEREVLAEATAIHESSSPEEGDSEIEPPGEEMAFADDADATQVAPAPDTLAAEEAAERDWAEHARRDAEDAVRGEEEEAARRAAPLQALSFADEAPQPEPEDTSSGEAEDAALREAEEAALREAKEAAAAAQREAEEAALREAEEAALGEAEEVARREAEEVARREAEEAALREAEEAALREAEEAALREAEEVALREAEEAALREAEEAAQREAEEAAQREAEEAAQREAEEAALREAEEVAQREAEEAARREAEEAAQREAEEAAAAAQREAEEAAWREAAESAQREAEAAAQREVEEAALREAEAAAQREVEEAALREAEAAAQRELEEAGLHEAEAAAQREVEEAAQREAEEAALREMEAAAQREAEEAALREAQETARREAQEAARREAEERAREQAEIAARQVAEELSRQHARELAAAEERLRHQSEQRDLEQRELEHRFAAEAAQREAQLRVELERAAQVQRDLEQRLEAEAEARARLEEQGSVLRAQLEAEARARQDMESRLAEREAALAAARQREAELLQREQEAAKFAEKLKHAAKKVKQDTEARAGALRRESEAAIAALRQEVEKASDLARLEREERERLEARLAELQGVSDEAQARAESALRIAEEERRQLEAEQRARAEAEAAAVEAKAAAEEIAQRIARPLEIPGAPTVHFPPTATVSIEQLARMVAELARARAEVRIDLRVDDALRTLWLERGALVGAQSSLAHESILDRARRDGLIDGRQEAELRLLRGASPAEFLQQLRARGFLRDQEVVPLVQRHTEAVALEALAEPRSDYRLTVEPPSPDLPVAASPRPTLALVVEALRRGLDLDAHVAPRGGLAALPAPEDAPGDLRPLGLSEREVRLLSLIDGDTSVEELLLASGLKQEAALRLLAAGEVLGWLAIRPAPLEELPPTPELELARLDAKYREVQEVDYFSILGLARSAGGDEVQRAYAQLSTEFDPLKYVGHPDVSIQHRARQIQEALSEAAQVLGDDGLRANYARHLLD